MTSASWGIERDVVQVSDFLEMPYPFVTGSEPEVFELCALVDLIQGGAELSEHLVSQVDELVYAALGLYEHENQLIADAVSFTIPTLYPKLRSRAFSTPSQAQLEFYGDAVVEVLNKSLNSSGPRFNHRVLSSSDTASIVSFSIDGSESSSTPIDSQMEVSQALDRGISKLQESHQSGSAFHRTLKIFDNLGFHIVKPNESRLWTKSAGYNDADSVLGQLARVEGQHSVR